MWAIIPSIQPSVVYRADKMHKKDQSKGISSGPYHSANMLASARAPFCHFHSGSVTSCCSDRAPRAWGELPDDTAAFHPFRRGAVPLWPRPLSLRNQGQLQLGECALNHSEATWDLNRSGAKVPQAHMFFCSYAAA